MLPGRRYAEWRPVRSRRIPVAWYGVAVGAFFFVVLCVLTRQVNYAYLFLSTFVSGFASNRLVVRQMRNLRDEGDDHQFGATLLLSREAVYGQDEGLISFEDGWMIYTGRRCTFSVGAGDVRKIARRRGELKFDFGGSGGDHTARLSFKADPRFADAAIEWIRMQRSSKGAVYPPARPNPHALDTGAAIVGGVAAVCLVGIAAAFLRGDSFEGIFVSAMVLIVLGAAIAYARDLRRTQGRIDRGEPAGLPFGSRPIHFRLTSKTPKDPPSLPPS